MREIKFRGFNTKRNQWLHGSHILNRGTHFVAPDEFADGKTWEDYEVEEESIGQFTGLHDKNGKEIYEGDIVRYRPNNKTYQVVFKDGIFFGEGIDGDGAASHFFPSCEIVGNVYNNPKLIEKGGNNE